VTSHDTTDAFASPSLVSFSVHTLNISQTVRVAEKDDHVDEMFESHFLDSIEVDEDNAYVYQTILKQMP
jgi:hypothetical protein